MKKILCALVTLGLIVGSQAPMHSTKAATATFTDVPNISPYFTYISDLQQKNVVAGYQGKFDPSGELTRAQFAVMLVQAFGLQKSTKPVKFADSSKHWGAPYIEAGVEAGVISGTSDTTFAPDSLVTREQAASLIWRMLAKNGVASKSDSVLMNAGDPTDSWAQDAVKNVLAYKLHGIDVQDGVYHSQKTMSRQEAAALLDLALKVPATPKTIVVNPTSNTTNLIDQGDGSKQLGNVSLDTSVVQHNHIDQLQLKSNLELLSKTVITISGNHVSISVPATGSASLVWDVSDDTNHSDWMGSDSKSFKFNNTKSVSIALIDPDTAHMEAACSLVYQDGKWQAIYPKF